MKSGKKLLASLTFDDGLDVHLDVALPVLDSHGLLGTFYVSLNSPGFAPRIDEWRAASRRGHELGNHTIFHPAVRGKPYVSEGNCIENYSLDRMRIELETANEFLSGLDGRKERSFAYPCSNPVLGRPGLAKAFLRKVHLERTRVAGWLESFPQLDFFSRQRDYSVLIPKLFYAARGGGFQKGAAPVPAALRYFAPCVAADGMDADGLSKTLESFKEKGNWIVFMFHGIGGGHRLTCARGAFEHLVELLAEDPLVSVLPFVDAARELWEGRNWTR